MLLRFGSAQVHLEAGRLRIEFKEPQIPELSAVFDGQIVKSGKVRGELKGFFFHGSEILEGVYRRMEPENGCRLQEIMLRSGLSDGSVLMISRVQGQCVARVMQD